MKEPRITAAEVQRHVAVLDLEDGRSVVVPLPETVRVAPKQLRRRWVVVGDGAGLHWPGIGEDLILAEVLEHPPLQRTCRFCQGTSRWNSSTCDVCGAARWNDPDDTKLGADLGEEERRNYEAALAASKLERP
jgi:hypothetical protein